MNVRALSHCYRSFTALLAVTILLAGLNACQGGKKQEAKSTATPGTPGEISGTITVDPALKDKVGSTPLLMIFASSSSDQTRPALVVKREAGVSFPYSYKITAEDITLVGSSFQGAMYVTARIDPAGSVGPPRPGTLGGTYPGNPVPVGSSKVDIVINKAY
jgi:hypothetical protein